MELMRTPYFYRGIIRNDVKVFLYNVVFTCDMNIQKAFDTTYTNYTGSEWRGNRLYHKVMKIPQIKSYFDNLVEEYKNQANLLFEIRDMLNTYKSEKKYKEYNDLLKQYTILLEKYNKNDDKKNDDTIDIRSIEL